MADSAARVRVFSDDGKCVARRGADAPRAGVRQGVRRRRRPARAGAAAHRGRADERGRALRRARPARAGRRSPRRRSSPATCLLAAHVGSRLHVCHVSTAGSVEILRWAKSKGWNVTAEVTPAPPAAHRRAGRDLRPGLQGQPAAAHRRRRRGAARRRSPTAPSTPSPPTTRRTRARTRTASGPRRRSACSASRPRCRSCRRRWSRPACSTGPASPTGCPYAPARIGRLDRPRPPARGRRAGQPRARRPGGPPDGRPGRARVAVAATRRTPGASCPARVVATFLRGRADRPRREAGPMSRATPPPCSSSRTAGPSAARPTAPSARPSARPSSPPA